MVLQRMQQRRYTATQWASRNDVLLPGELGVELDTAKWKIGDGTTTWTGLPYQPSNAGITAAINAAVTGLVNGSPGALDTLKELADALGDDPNFATTITNALTAKANTSSLAPVATAGTYASLTGKPTLGTAAAAATSDFDAAGAATTAQAYAIQRSNHTGTQAASTVTGLAAVATSGLKADVGLGNVDNTADTAKPVSTAQAAADAVVRAAAADLSIFVPGSLHWFYNPVVSSLRTVAHNANRLVLHAFYSGSEAITIDKFDINVTTAAATGAVTRVGVYTLSNQTQPFKWLAGTAWGTLTSDVGTLDTTAVGQKTLTPGTAITIPANTWFAVGGADQVAATSATRSVGGNTGSAFATKYGSSSTTGSYGTGGAGIGLYMDSVSGALPATFTPNGILAQDSGVGIHRSA